MKNNITFFIRISSKSDFAKCSNFIKKVLLHQELDLEETENVVFLRETEEDEETGGWQWRKNMLSEYKIWKEGKESRFQTIKEPKGIKNLNDRFPVSYLLYINESDMPEIAQFKELILLHEGYKRAAIYSVIEGDRNLYFKLSQYLFDAVNTLELRDRIFFKLGEGLKRFQKSALQATHYLPVIVINRENKERLKEKCKVFLHKEVWIQILSKEVQKYSQIKGEIEWLELGGIVRLLIGNKKVIENLPSEEVYRVLSELDVLALAFFAYSLDGYAEDMSLNDLIEYIKIQQQYANACHQLLENVLFHSVAGWGILSIRMHKSDNEEANGYLQQQYSLNDKKSYFEVYICDFAGERENKNIAETFVESLNENDRKLFKDICPENLFRSALGEKDCFEESWRRYYSEAAHFGKHVGLRIFQRITCSNEGCFVAESHREHRNREGEIYCYQIKEKKKQYVMPGTTYHILLPLRKAQISVKTKDVSQEYGDWITQDPKRLLSLHSCIFSGEIENYQYNSQKGKNDCIGKLAQGIVRFLEDRTENILAIDASKIQADQGELWVKGLMLAAYELHGERHFAFYNCTEEYTEAFHDAICQVSQTVQCGMPQWSQFQIALIGETYEQIAYLPGDMEMTDAVNKYYSRIKGIKCRYLLNENIAENKLKNAAREFIPFETLISDGEQTLFEKYVVDVLRKNIQSEEFGCQITNTHMRLGSTIHINQFYEGELLFGNRYFVSRFAFLMLQEMYEDIIETDKITLYGYANYSETLLVTLQNAIAVLKGCDKKEIDYIILEREEEHRGMPHVDNIRYSGNLSEDERKKHMQERSYIVVVPINSTLKTHQRLLSLLREQNGMIPNEQILRNYALILVGPQECKYWKRVGKRELWCEYDIQPMPKYFVSLLAEYQESLTCKMCFPENPLHEIPLIEVNAASTIPNQAFGVVKGEELKTERLEMISGLIQEEKEKMEVLRDCFLYGHIQRNDTHYLYYIKTEKLVVKAENQILQSLRAWKKNIEVKPNEYHVIVSPAHFSNCRFVEMVNGEIFDGMATVLRIDFNKDYRANTYVKYSNIRQYISQMEELPNCTVIKFHYVDDNIITGKTFYRAKSIVETIVDQYKRESHKVNTVVFDRIFTLIDRNSIGSRMQYIKDSISMKEVDNYFYYFLHLEISSLRNYGDSCVICNLHNEAKHLYQTAATRIVADYWGNSDEKFQIRSLAEEVEIRNEKWENDQKKEKRFRNRSYRRIFCTHTTRYILDTVGYDNQAAHVAKIILKILIEDYKGREDKEEAFEYFVSYIKTTSRPFLVFHKAVKEAIYDILLIIIEYIVKGKDIKTIILERGNKNYWLDVEEEWEELNKLVFNQLTGKKKRQLVLVVMKQLTELKSNYILRLENMNALFDFIQNNLETLQSDESEEEIREDFRNRYIIMIKKLTGISSDTSKSVWLDYALIHKRELTYDREIPLTENMDPMFMQSIILENTVNYQDGIGKIYRKIKEEIKEKKCKCIWDDKIYPLYQSVCKVEHATLVAGKYFSNWRQSKENQISEMSIDSVFDELLMHLSTKSNFSPSRAEEAYNNEEYREKIMDLAERKLNKFTTGENEPDYVGLGSDYGKITQGYQFYNFLYFMKEMGWYQDKFNTEGVIQITGCLIMKHICEDKKDDDETLLQKIEEMSKIAGWILGDIPVKMWAEYYDSAEFYKAEINQIIRDKLQGDKSDKKLELKLQKHYHTVGDNVGYIAELDREEQEWLNDTDILTKLEKYGYYLGEGKFVWKIGRESKYPIYLLAKLLDGENNQQNMIYRIRNLLSLSNDVEKCLAGKQNYFHETELANSRLNVLQREKSFSHTKEENRINNFKSIVGGNPPERDDTLVLLADLDVSRTFRSSLNREFYHELNAPGKVEWGTFSKFLKEDICEGMHGNTLPIIVNRQPILKEDQKLAEKDEIIISYKREQELMSIILALILNVKEKGRGKANEKGEIEVYVSKSANGMLHILNETDCEKTALQRIKGCMEQEPASEESGITLWALNSYIKKVKVACASQIVEQMSKENINKAAAALKRLTESEFELKVEIVEEQKKRYFRYEIPILRQKYEQLINSVSENRE